MGPKLGLLGPIDFLLVYLAQNFVSLCKAFPNPTECDLHGYEADHLSTLSFLLNIVRNVLGPTSTKTISTRPRTH